MRIIGKFLMILAIIVFVSIYYIHQQTTLIRLSYQIGKNKEILSSLLNENSYLMYNNSKKKTPQNIEIALVSNNLDFCIPDKNQIVYLDTDEARSEKISKTNQAGLFNIFGISREAEAESIQY